MKQQSKTSSLLRTFGITPQTVFLLLLGIFISGVLLGLLVLNSDKSLHKPRTIPNITQKKSDTTISKKNSDFNPVSLAGVSNKNLNKPTSDSKNFQIKNKEKAEIYTSDSCTKKILLPKKTDTNNSQLSLYNQNKVLFDKYDIKTPVIALVIDDMGIDMLRSQKMLKIPELYTFSFLTYAPNLQAQINHAKSFGTEILLHIPMEAISNTYDYGPEYLSTNLSKDENIKLLSNMLNRVSGYIGINNHMGSKFTADYSQLFAVIEELKKRGLMFLDSKTTPNSKADNIVHENPLPYASRDIFIDDNNKPADIQKSLAHLEHVAKKYGYAVAIAHPRENTITALSNWVPTLKDKGITSVPLSYIVDNFPKK